MKKIIFGIIVVFLFLFSACNENDNVQKLMSEIDSLPAVSDLEISDENAIEEVLKKYSSLSSEDQLKITNYDKLDRLVIKMKVIKVEQFISELVVNESATLDDEPIINNIEKMYNDLLPSEKEMISNYSEYQIYLKKFYAVKLNNVINTLPDPSEFTKKDYDVVDKARKMYQFIDESQRQTVENHDKLEALIEKLEIIDKYQNVISQINALPSVNELVIEDEDKLNLVIGLYNELDENSKNEVINYNKLVSLVNIMTSLKTSEATGSREYYVSKEQENYTINLNLKRQTIKSLYLNETQQLTGFKKENDVIILEDAILRNLKYGENQLEITDSESRIFKFILYYNISKEDIAYFDFEVNKYENYNAAAVPSTIDDTGIDGPTLHLTQSYEGGTLFGFNEEGDNGFQAFTFKPNTEYMLSFDFKVLRNTSSDWWSPVRFGEGKDVIYIYKDYSWKNPDLNTLYTQTTVAKNADGSRRATAIFKTNTTTKNLEIPSFGGKVDILLDNICIKVINPDAQRIACVGDSITEAANTDFSYPEQLQVMLGYDNYFVFNFGKSASNVLIQGAYPYRTWAEWQYNHLLQWNPDTIVMMLGTNDGRYETGIDNYKDTAFIEDYMSLVNEFKSLCSNFYINSSPYAFGNEYGIKASCVNDRIVFIQGYLAYTNNIKLFDVHAAVKACDRAQYFPDYIHGNDAGYGVIAETVKEGLEGKEFITKYHLGYALMTCNDKESDNYINALSVYENATSTKQEIDDAFESIKNLMSIPR